MHPTRREIERVLLGIASEEAQSRVTNHLGECRICQEIADQFREFQAAIPAVTDEDLAAARQVMDDLYCDACRGQIISLTPLTASAAQEELCLAADGKPAHPPEIEELATLVSDANDLVLRLMRDHVK